MKASTPFSLSWSTDEGSASWLDTTVAPEPPALNGRSQRSISRTIFVALGERAESVCATAVRQSECWMQTAPPLVWFGVGTERAIDEQDTAAKLADAIKSLAARALTATLLEHGYVVSHHDEIQVFLVADVSAVGEASDNAGAARILTVLHELEESVRRELRARTAAHVLLLAEPSAQRVVARWARALHAGGMHDIWLAGPVSIHHERLGEHEWIAHTARALAAQAWAAFPSHAGGAEADKVRIVGADGWDTDLAAVRRWIALRSAQASIASLRRDDIAGMRADPFDVTAESLAASLAHNMPGPLPPLPLVGGPEWAHLEDLAARLIAETEKASRRYLLRLRPARMNWLSTQVDEWRGRLEESASISPAPEHLLALGSIRIHLETMTAAVRSALGLVSDLLETAGTEISTCDQAVQMAVNAVAEAAQIFPSYSLAGLLRLVAQPWRWPMWAWVYAVDLPARCRRLVAALAARHSAVWHEENLHVLRQLYLTMQQDLNVRRSKVERLDQITAAASDLLAEERQTLQRAIAAPWTPERLEGLWREQESAVVAERLDDYLLQSAPATWTTGRALADGLTDACLATEPPLIGWGALDCLTEGLVRAEAAQRDPVIDLLRTPPVQEPFAWLDRTLEGAAPLWPRPVLAQETAEQRWLLLPVSPRSRESRMSLAFPNSHARFQWWVETQTNPVELCWLAGDAVVVLRWLAVAVGDLESDL